MYSYVQYNEVPMHGYGQILLVYSVSVVVFVATFSNLFCNYYHFI